MREKLTLSFEKLSFTYFDVIDKFITFNLPGIAFTKFSLYVYMNNST